MVIGTVKGDIHDIGKNLVGMMMEGAGFEVIGVVARSGGDAFLAAIEERMHSYVASLVEKPVDIVASVLGFESVAIGGLALALESMRD